MKRALIMVAGSLIVLAGLVAAGDFGVFIGKVRAEWDDDGRRMRLLERFIYQDQNGRRWVAPENSTLDGATIPRWLWALIGGPYEGQYRNASVVHDVECQTKTHRWRDVHLMFYNAMRCGGVQSLKAKIMYGAVYHFGPRWLSAANASSKHNRQGGIELARNTQEGPIPSSASDVPPRTLEGRDDYLRMKEYIEQHPEISLQSIEDLTSAFLRKEIKEVAAPLRTLNDEYPDVTEGGLAAAQPPEAQPPAPRPFGLSSEVWAALVGAFLAGLFSVFGGALLHHRETKSRYSQWVREQLFEAYSNSFYYLVKLSVSAETKTTADKDVRQHFSEAQRFLNILRGYHSRTSEEADLLKSTKDLEANSQKSPELSAAADRVLDIVKDLFSNDQRVQIRRE
jgi:hypothetical protein